MKKRKISLFLILALFIGASLFNNCYTFSASVNNEIYSSGNVTINGSQEYFFNVGNVEGTGEFNKFIVEYSSNTYVKGEFTYRNNEEGTYTERFFLEPTNGNSKTFYSYIDGGMEGTRHSSRDTITQIKFTNIGDESGNLNISRFSVLNAPTVDQITNVTDQSYRDQGTYVIGNQNLQLGISLKWGGGINFLIANQNIYSTLAGINLVNRHDSGRLIQQAYYQGRCYKGEYDPDNEICRTGTFYSSDIIHTEGRYNPLQGGNSNINFYSKIIDIGISADNSQLTVVTKPALWELDNEEYKNDNADLYDNVLADAYIYATYILHDRYVEVQNKYIDFSINAIGAMEDRNEEPRSQEEPAVYLINSLENFVAGNYAIANSHEVKAYGNGLGSNSQGLAEHANWAGYFNAAGEGVGIYSIPRNSMNEPMHQYFSFWRTSYDNSVSADPSMDDATKYFAAITHAKIERNKPEEYTYLITLGNITSADDIIASYYYAQNEGHNLTIDANGGTVYGESLKTINSPKLFYKYENWSRIEVATKTGYDLAGYYTSKTGGELVYNSDGTAHEGSYWHNNKYQKNEPLKVYAQWKIHNYQLSYNLKGGTASNPSQYNIETKTFTLKNPTRNGYTFTGWTGDNGNTPQKNVKISKGSTGNKTYKANWQAINYDITYDLGGGTASNPTQYNIETKTFTLKNPTRAGYTFAGWTGSNGNTPQTTVKITEGSTGARTYKANWVQDMCTVNGTGFRSIQEAINSSLSNNKEIKILVDSSENFNIPSNKTVTINFNSHTINGCVDNYGDLTVKGAGTLNCTQSNKAAIYNTNRLNVNNMTVRHTSGNTVVYAFNARGNITNSRILSSGINDTALILVDSSEIDVDSSEISNSNSGRGGFINNGTGLARIKNMNLSNNSTIGGSGRILWIETNSVGFTTRYYSTASYGSYYFPTWSDNNGQDDITWKCTNQKTRIGVTDWYVQTSTWAEHNNDYGTYNVHVYPGNGNCTAIVGDIQAYMTFTR